MEEYVDVQEMCKYCENCTVDYVTKKTYCSNISGLRLALFGPRRVHPCDTCKQFALHSKYNTRSR